MKVLAISFVLVAIANARPDVSHLPSASYLPVGQQPSGYGHTGIDQFNTIDDSSSNGFHQMEDQKHLYFYAAPDDHYYTHVRINVAPKSQKNTKIIFIKTPHHAGVIPEVVAPPSSAEDKTLVYVLVKKPLADQAISVPAGFGIKQSKPEVFFIKYNNKHEAEAQVNGGIQGQQVGVTVPDLPNEYAFVNALESQNGHGTNGGGNYHAGGSSNGYLGGDHGSAGISSHVETSNGAAHHGPVGILVSLVAIASARPSALHLPSGSYLPAVSSEKNSLKHNQEEDETNFYFYGSPNDASYTHYKINIVPKTKKNTKVIFVKAPHHAGIIPDVVAPSSSIQDKTLVYVLVKKPVDDQSVSIPANLGIKQAKPEVFFIKYNDKHEAEAIVNNGIGGQNAGVNVPELPNQLSFLNALATEQEQGYHYEPKSTTDAKKMTVAIDEPAVHVDDVKEDLPAENNVLEFPNEFTASSLVSQDSKTNTIADIQETNNGVDSQEHLNASDDDCISNEDKVPTVVDIGDGFESNERPTLERWLKKGTLKIPTVKLDSSALGLATINFAKYINGDKSATNIITAEEVTTVIGSTNNQAKAIVPKNLGSTMKLIPLILMVTVSIVSNENRYGLVEATNGKPVNKAEVLSRIQVLPNPDGFAIGHVNVHVYEHTVPPTPLDEIEYRFFKAKKNSETSVRSNENDMILYQH
ncbi:hypothetical protein RN001_012052 [Aquatica leii]|uniref:DUF243 domain-containing protein n=1 Tax=Aquatica leii TaxID=1421715 RepID=A0AAN7Q197_9COLE|nr:hypothetical protein RN001_012052 [Aquatica leii]